MRSVLLFILIIAFVEVSNARPRRGSGSRDIEMSNELDSVSYALGYLEAKQMKGFFDVGPFEFSDFKDVVKFISKLDIKDEYGENRIDQFGGLNNKVFKAAFVSELANEESYLDEDEASEYLYKVYNKIQQKRGGEALQRGEAFLEENAKRNEVVVLESGLQYEILKQGDGDIPSIDDAVLCKYHGTLINGEVFDSTIENEEPSSFYLNKVIDGWAEALQLMPVGSKWKLYIPAELGYGERGAGDAVGPNEVLIFEVELLGIE